MTHARHKIMSHFRFKNMRKQQGKGYFSRVRGKGKWDKGYDAIDWDGKTTRETTT